MHKPRIMIDVGGVIFHEMDKDSNNWDTVYPFGIEAVNKIYDSGKNEVILWTSRYTDEHHINPYNDYAKGYIETLQTLNRAGVKFHELWMGKPKYELWIDNKACHVDSEKGKEEWDKVWNRLEKVDEKTQEKGESE